MSAFLKAFDFRPSSRVSERVERVRTVAAKMGEGGEMASLLFFFILERGGKQQTVVELGLAERRVDSWIN